PPLPTTQPDFFNQPDDLESAISPSYDTTLHYRDEFDALVCGNDDGVSPVIRSSTASKSIQQCRLERVWPAEHCLHPNSQRDRRCANVPAAGRSGKVFSHRARVYEKLAQSFRGSITGTEMSFGFPEILTTCPSS